DGERSGEHGGTWERRWVKAGNWAAGRLVCADGLEGDGRCRQGNGLTHCNSRRLVSFLVFRSRMRISVPSAKNALSLPMAMLGKSKVSFILATQRSFSTSQTPTPLPKSTQPTYLPSGETVTEPTVCPRTPTDARYLPVSASVILTVP